MTTVSAPVDALSPRLEAIEKLILRRELQQAAQDLNAIVRKAPGDARVYLMGCRLAEAAGNAQGSIDMARRAVGAAPGWSVALTELSMALARANQFAEAVAAAQKAVQMDPQNPGLLSRVIDVAHRAQRPDVALPWLQTALGLAPEANQRHLRHLIARDLRQMQRNDEAVAAYGELLADDGADLVARLGRLQAALAAGQPALAQTDAAALLAQEPDSAEARFWNEVAHSRTPDQQPSSVAEARFDGVASIWDQYVVGLLKYKLPKLVADRVLAWHPDRKLNVLDLGCGTGLLGVALGRLDGALVGVDISRGMIDQAVRHNLYDKFHHVDIGEALAATPESLYDLIAALDVFIYTGDLSRAVPDAHRILKPGGRLVFSCESAAADEADLVLRPTTRYAHKASAVEALCRAAGFTDVQVETLALRNEGDVPVEGFLVTARKG